LRPKLELLGQVSELKGSKLLLTDTEGIDEIESGEALLEHDRVFERLHQVVL
jgi:hypothetical protein